MQIPRTEIEPRSDNEIMELCGLSMELYRANPAYLFSIFEEQETTQAS